MGIFDRFKKKSSAEESSVQEEEQGASPGAPSEATTERPSDPTTPADAGMDRSGQDAEAPVETTSFFGRFRAGLEKTRTVLNTDIRDLFKAEGRLVDDQFLDDLFAILVKTDMGAGPANEIRQEIHKAYRARVVHMDDVVGTVKEKFKELLAQPPRPIEYAESGPTVVMVVGVNGSGKTTSIAKLASQFQQVEGKQVVLGAGDTFRAAAVEQLTIWAGRIGAEIVKGEPGADPASVAHRAVAKAIETNADVCIIDTAGRLQTQKNLMQQLAKIRRVITKQIPDAPHEVLLVLDATAGQNGISQAQGFSEAAECTGIVLAKLDGTAKGGVIIPIRQKFDLPVKYVGTGETERDLSVFQVEAFVDALFADVA